MSNKDDLRTQRNGTVINTTSKAQEKRLGNSLPLLCKQLSSKYGVQLKHESQWLLRDVVGKLRHNFPEVSFNYIFDTSSMRPDGGILSLVDKYNTSYPILITEVKNQGTNDLRESEGKSKQARGNAIERLGKNVIGFRASLLNESIFPFVCFGDGCDFAHDSSIVDRVVTIAMFGEINKTSLHNEGNFGQFNRGSFYFRVELWTENDMLPIMLDIADRSILYYFSKYGMPLFR
jgi:Restriction endonuclease EcoRI.